MNNLTIQNPNGTVQVNGSVTFIQQVMSALSEAGLLKEASSGNNHPVAPTTQNGVVTYYFKDYKQADATGYLHGKSFLIKAGSFFASEETSSIPKHIKELRHQLKNDGTLVQAGPGRLRLNRDYIFSTPSAAACAVTGSSRNGWGDWKDVNGNTLDQERK